jgi:hypothetical protein
MKLLKWYLENPIFWIIALFILSSIFRIFFLGNTEFKADEALTFFTIFEFVKNHQFPIVGIQSSTGFHNFPFAIYVLSIPSFIILDPQFLTFCIALLNVIAVPFFYLIVRKFYSNYVAVVSSLLLALSPWSILFSRKIWAQDLLIPFILPFFYFLHRLIISHDKKSSFWLFFFAALLLQIHGSGIIFVLITIGILTVKRISCNYRQCIFGFLAGIIPVIPYFYYQVFSGTICKDCSTFMFVRNQMHGFDYKHFLRPFQLLTGIPFNFELGSDYRQFIQLPLVQPLQIVFLITVVLCMIGIFFILFKLKSHLFLLLYILLLPLIYYISGIQSYIHYYVLLIPIMAIVSALGLQFLNSFVKDSVFKYSVMAIFICMLIGYMIFEIQFNTFISSKRIIHGDYGPIFEISDIELNSQLFQYKLSNLSYYDELKYYGFIYLPSSKFHAMMGDYLVGKGNVEFALSEYTKELKLNPNDTTTEKNIHILENTLKR